MSRKRVLEVAMSVLVKSIIFLSMLTLAWASHTDVYVKNSLEGKEDLHIHCKSKDDDLGSHVLRINQTFKISFKTNFFYGTLFFCSFQWGNGLFLRFDVYDQTRDSNKCTECKWFIKKDGPCRDELQLDSTYLRKCYEWNH
ncbi:hypothetical protein VNO80_07695 [Phaseolus coccineus]|uniref:S-protein homolog n=1 Tax=Phaseolus coccineus TaxID=3886 RepID=A0AAN9RK48_PHACN